MKNNLTNMMCLDLYVDSLNETTYNETTPSLKSSTHKNINILSWGIKDLFEENTMLKDLYSLEKLANGFNWKNKVNSILKKHSYESLVVTNLDKNIIWVNDGFKKMTGYTKEFAINKTPSFLQGEETSEASKRKIRKKLLKNKPFKEVIINYKKDRSTYKCELHVFPLFSETTTTHFLALEKEVV